MKLLLKSSIFSIIFLGACQIALAQPNATQASSTGNLHPHMMVLGEYFSDEPGPQGQAFAQKLNLTVEQQSKIAAIHRNFFESRRADFEAHRKRMEADSLELERQIESVLTPEQLKRYREMLPKLHTHCLPPSPGD